MGWVIIHWFELGTLELLCLNLWFVSSVLSALRETNRWLTIRANWAGPQSHFLARAPHRIERASERRIRPTWKAVGEIVLFSRSCDHHRRV